MNKIISDEHIINGKFLADVVIDEVKSEISDLLKYASDNHVTQRLPHLAIILVGDNPASELYVKTKSNRAKEIGIETSLYKFSNTVKEQDILFLIDTLNKDSDINGIMIQLPLPKNINTENILNSVLPIKDVDGTCDNSEFIPATARAIIKVIDTVTDELNIDLNGKVATVIGSSKEVGKPVHNILISKGISSQIVDKNFSEDYIKNLCTNSDIIVSATGSAGLIKQDWVKYNSIVVDVGITKIGVSASGKAILRGDADIDNIKGKVVAITPVVGGIGPITVSMLMSNIVQAYKLQYKE